MEVNPLKQLYTDFITILKSSTIKYKVEADKYETLEMKKSADEYINASLYQDTFNSYYRYNRDVLADVLNLTNEDEISLYEMDRSKIPYNRRDLLLKKQRQYVIDNYVEKNNYYRYIHGLPEYEEDESNYIYVSKDICLEYSIPVDKPIHELSDSHITTLNQIGYIDKLISTYPDKKYLNFLGSNKIDYVTSRKAKNFSIIRQPAGISESLLNNFILIYEQCREYFMVCIYITEYRNTIDYYDNFIAMCIMIMTIQQIIARIIKNTIERDFFDNYCCKILFGIYGVPYNPNMDSTTRTQLIQNLNILVKNKGTSQVIYDIASILGYDSLQIYKYYLIKSQRFDHNGLPIELTTTDPDTGQDVPDYKNMFDVYFQRVPIEDDDLYDSIINTNNTLSYEEITEMDPYWWHDDNVERLLYESEYNYVETKYMGVGISYRMTKVLFENIYLLKMIFDKKDNIPDIKIDLSKISNVDISLFDTIALMCALLCKQNKLKGEILISESKILHVLNFTRNDFNTIGNSFRGSYDGRIMGFDLERDVESIKNDVRNNQYLDDTLCQFFTDQLSYTAEGINTLYKNYKLLYNELVEKMSTTNDKDVYQAYKKFYRAFFYTKENRMMFNVGTNENPVYPETFMDYIRLTHPDIYNIVKDMNETDIHSTVNYLVSMIAQLIPNLHTLGFFNDHSSAMETMLLELIRFFKSYTTDLLNMNILYIFDLKPDSIFRLIDTATTYTNMTAKDFVNMSYSDHVNFISSCKYDTRLALQDNKFGSRKIRKINMICSNVKFANKSMVHSSINASDYTMVYNDIAAGIRSGINLYSNIKFKDICKVSYN